MTLLLTLLLGAGLHFEPQELGEIYIAAVDPLSGVPGVNFVHADLDRDGLQDLLLPGVVCFQRHGTFPKEDRVPLPEMAAMAALDVAGGELYALGDSLRIFRWEAGAWSTLLDQPFPAGGGGPPEVTASLQRYLHDFEADGIPEIVVPAADGVHVFSKQEDRYVPALTLDILPPLDLVPGATPVLWPLQERRLELPVQQMSCRLLLNGNKITVLQRRAQADDSQDYFRTDHVLAGMQLQSGAAAPSATGLRSFLRPCRLNGDDRIDFAGGEWLPPASKAFPVPVYETWASVNGGADFKIIRVPSFQRFRPHCSFLDVDGDGDKDLVAESTALFRSGPREMVVQLMTRSDIEHVVDVYLQGDAGFDAQPARTASFSIDLEMVPLKNGPMFQRYQLGELVDLSGDFDGNGQLDALVRGHLEKARIYLSTSEHYAESAQPIFDVPRGSDVRVYDLNADGRSDVILQPRQVSDDQSLISRVLFSMEETSR